MRDETGWKGEPIATREQRAHVLDVIEGGRSHLRRGRRAGIRRRCVSRRWGGREDEPNQPEKAGDH